MKKKRVVLSSEGQHGYRIFGLSADVEDFKLAFLLNKRLEINLVREDDLMVYPDEKSDPIPFSYFHFNRDKQTCYYLIHKLKEHQPLMKEYFLLVNGFFTEADDQALVERVGGIGEVLTVNLMKQPESSPKKKSAGKSLKLINAIVTDLEYHNIEINRRKNESKVKLKASNTGKIKKLY
jgi:hypothetical protein